MSTEAQHAAIPPRPPKPPTAGTTPEPARDANDAPPSATSDTWSPWHRTPRSPQDDGEPDGESVRRPGPGAVADGGPVTGGAQEVRARFPRLRAPSEERTEPPPPQASARFPDAPPVAGREKDGAGSAAADAPPQPSRRPTPPPRPVKAPAETPQESTTRLRPIPPETEAVPPMPASRPQGRGTEPDPALSWSAPSAPSTERPVVSFAEPEGYDDRARPRPLGARVRPRTAAIAACLVLGLGLIGGAVTGSWLVGGTGDGGTRDTFAEAASLWHSVPVDRLFPPTVKGTGAGPGGADRTWTRVAVAPDSGCKGAFDPLLQKALAPAGCRRLLRATYTDATQSFVTTVGMVFTKADAPSMEALAKRFQNEGLGTRTDLMPRPFAEKDSPAARFGDKQRASWTISVLTDAPVVVYAVSGWTDGRTVDTPVPAEQATQPGTTSPPAQAGLGNEAQGLADRIERALRKDVTSPTEKPS